VTPEPLDLSQSSVDGFLNRTIAAEGFAEKLADRADIPLGQARVVLADLASEARLACRMLATLQPTQDLRILEVGAGAGVAATFLQQQGADVVAIEPLAEGFESFAAVRWLLAEQVRVPPIEPLAAEQLQPGLHGEFALIFSVNVLEHMRPLGANLEALASVLGPGGRMIHTCPNYRVPYEPHYRIPLVPGWPALTGLIARRARHEPTWDSLNWITAGDVKRFARRHAFSARFQPGELAAAVERLRNDNAFARRQRGLVAVAAPILDRLGLLGVLGRLPPSFSTPMTFTLTRPGWGAT
jgi:SAM-dependent methyltransferase